jgi:hypothetical protein
MNRLRAYETALLSAAPLLSMPASQHTARWQS